MTRIVDGTGLRCVQVLLELRRPELRVALGPGRLVAAGVLMPKATVDKDCRFARPKNDVRFPREVRRVQTIPVTQPMQKAAHYEFWSSIPSLNPAHVFSASLPVEMVNHY